MSDSDSYESADENLNTKNIKNIEKISIPDGDGWDVDDWGDDDDIDNKNETVKPDMEIQNKETAPLSEKDKKENNTLYSDNTNNKNINEKTEPQPGAVSSWVWKPWGNVVSLLSTATEGVTTLSSQVTQSLSTVIENSMGVPNPEELAKINMQKSKSNIDDDSSNINSENEVTSLGLGSIMTGVTSIGNKVISGGLDTLEEIGKKTMNILQENDPLLLNKRKFLGLDNEKPILSQALREAKEKSEEIEKNLRQIQKNSYKKQLHFESLFDEYYGLVHLEALEMLSKQSNLKLQSLLESLSGSALYELEETLSEVKELCELGEMDNEDNDGLYDDKILESKLLKCIEDLDIEINFIEILKCWGNSIEWLSKNSDSATDIYEHGLKCLAETCALIMLKMHKIAEMLLVKDHHSTANEADALVQLTQVFCFHLHGIANRFGSKLNVLEKTEEVNSVITSLFVEVFNSTTYVQSAFQLFIPILQVGVA